MVKEEEEDDDGKVQGHVNGQVKGGEQKADKEEDEVNVTWEYEQKVEEEKGLKRATED